MAVTAALASHRHSSMSSKTSTMTRKGEREDEAAGASTQLLYDDEFWARRLGPEFRKISTIRKAHLLFSLLIYLGETLAHFLLFVFRSTIPDVETRVTRFLAFYPAKGNKVQRFVPGELYGIWHEHDICAEHLHTTLVDSCIEHLVLEESDRLIKEKGLQIVMKKLTVDGLKTLLRPTKIMETYKALAPRTWQILWIFSASPNDYRKRKQRDQAHDDVDMGTSSEDLKDDLDDDELADDNLGSTTEGPDAFKEVPKPKNFLRNPTLAIIVVISMLIFVRNSRTNLLPLILGLFFRIGGTGSRVMNMLSNVGMSVSNLTVERLKEVISKDAVASAVQLMLGGGVFSSIFDNINIFVRKHQQRLTNRNEMLNVTNAAILRLDDIDFDHDEAKNLKARLDLRGKRSEATANDLKPTVEDASHMEASFTQAILEIIVRYTPGAQSWEHRKEYLEEVRNMMPRDRPLPPKKSDARPFGVFDVNEGSKKGVVKVVRGIQERSTMTQEQWEQENRIVGGDWLTASNIRAAKKDRIDDISVMERVENVAEWSQPFHFALQISHGITRAHYGNPANDPTSLSAHKGLLGRTWDANKPNYAPAKALLRHSLIARILHIVMVKYSLHRWSELEKWSPSSFQELVDLAKWIREEFATTSAANASKARENDWAAHDRFFIRDVLFFWVFEQAVSYADAGRMIRVFKYWAYFFRGVGQHNYARECAEVIIKLKYETPPGLQAALERSWFFNRFGLDGCWIAADLYLEQLNYWVKQVFVATGNGVTVQYIIAKGSACVEAFRAISHLVARFFGDSDRSRKSKEVAFAKDIQALVEEMERKDLHKPSSESQRHFVPAPPPKTKTGKASRKSGQPKSAVFDAIVAGAEIWNSGKFTEFIKTTTYDPAVHGYPAETEARTSSSQRNETADEHKIEGEDEQDELEDERLNSDTAFDSTKENPLAYNSYEDLHGDDEEDAGLGSLGGGGEFYTE